ncbi:helix-turn-helix domain-containing protein [Vagococcus xieshaowenii]|uniref:Mga helix-turn-helix domain-containing protein n=1 Tax=Vagococcus xieshaowenii TaxID=2562451 RepID=A0AAJ5EH06_9ENTE|nr:helix-turn-helix domain-containing protein [Vagococcus xieshaowenii]QCA29544.1 hypothetical protein E4Z98_09505 [Vagococcus xieshaowenii]TFZ42660.1 hypothetical protein E4031_02905 [Vagococcus xieshaowenii]
MYKLMEKQDQKKYQLLKYLQSSVNSTFTMDELIEQLQLSEAKLSEIIEELRLDYRQHYSREQEENMLQRNNFNKVIKGPNFSVEPFFNIFINRSIHYELAVSLFYNREINFEKLVMERQVSHSTVMRYWKHLKTVLNSYNIKVVKEHGSFILKGYEEHIRYFFFILFRDSGEKMSSYIKRTDLTFFDDAYTGSSVTQQQLDEINLFLAICLIRIKKGFYIEKEPEYFSIINQLYDVNKFLPTFEKFYLNKLPEASLNKELYFMYFFICTWTKYDFETVNAVKTYITPDNLDNTLFRLCNNIIFEASLKNNLHLSPTAFFYLFANLLITIRKNQVFGEIINANEEISDMDLFKLFSNKLPESFHLQKDISIEQLFMIFYPIFFTSRKNIKILLLSRFGLEYISLLKKKIPLMLNLDVTFVDLLSEEPDLIISDSFYEKEGIPTFYLPPYPNNKELSRLTEYIYNQMKKRL